MSPPVTEKFSDLVGAIYDCVLDPQQWPRALSAIQNELGFVNTCLQGVHPLTSSIRLYVCVDIDAEMLESLPSYAEDIPKLWGGLSSATTVPLEEPRVQSDMSSPAVWAVNPYAQEILVPRGLHDCLASVLLRDSEFYGVIAFGQHVDDGPIQAGAVDQLRLLTPHLRRAISISRLLEQQTIIASTFVEVIDALRVGVVLVGANLEVVHANVAARAMFDAGDPIQMRGGQLAVRSPLSAKVLAHAVAQAAHREMSMERRSIDIPAPRGTGAPAVLQVLPLTQRRQLTGLKKATAVAAVFVADSAEDLRTTASVMALLYNLTPAESRVFEMIVEGRSPAEIAESLCLTLPTVRTHLSRVLSKTGCERQAELIALSSRIPMFA